MSKEKKPSHLEEELREQELDDKKFELSLLKKRKRISRVDEIFGYGLSTFCFGAVTYRFCEYLASSQPFEESFIYQHPIVSALLIGASILNGVHTYKKHTKKTKQYSTQISDIEKEIEKLGVN